MGKITRRDWLKISGLSAGALMAGNVLNPEVRAAEQLLSSIKQDSKVREHIQESFYIPGERLASDEMRITFMGTNYIPRVGQACNSVFVEVGTGESFVFDCGSGVLAKYIALGVPYSRMTRIFLTHLHADHMSDLVMIYCSGLRATARRICTSMGPAVRSTRTAQVTLHRGLRISAN